MAISEPYRDVFSLNEGVKVRLRRQLYYSKEEVLEIVRELFEMVRELHEAGVVAIVLDPARIVVDPRRSLKRSFGPRKRILEITSMEDI